MKLSPDFVDRRDVALVATLLTMATTLGGCALNQNAAFENNRPLVSCSLLESEPTVQAQEAIDPGGDGSCIEANGSIRANGGGRG